MASIGTVTADIQLTGSAIRLRALELALKHEGQCPPLSPASKVVETAAAFEEYLTGKTSAGDPTFVINGTPGWRFEDQAAKNRQSYI